MAPKMSTYASRERAAQAFQLRANRLSWREIADRLEYRSVGAAQSAVSRHVERERRDAPPTTIEAHKYAMESRTRALTQRFVAAYQAKNDDALVMLNREIARNEVELAKLGGLYEPARLDVTVTADPSALIAQARDRLLAVLAEREQHQPAAIGGGVIEGEVIG
ncbi:hypothetical protein A5719_10320 [Mycolicibacterium peregrinum]|uniref:hypothetical protein n=1 Tax=Mycolicibacterium peregrinum TaxID=43304 RepID=UPI0007EAE420|nr:hypothetical protein [Mycolicibacterium peregrinum]OBF42829.1 hypothetical protein A5719_10320 [Mycolicibacterium peregrinum]